MDFVIYDTPRMEINLLLLYDYICIMRGVIITLTLLLSLFFYLYQMPSLTQKKKKEKEYKSYNNTFSKLHFLYSTSNTQENENVY